MIFFSFCFFGSHPVVLKGYSWFFTQDSLLMIGEPYGVLGIEPGVTAYKVSTLPTVISLWPLK